MTYLRPTLSGSYPSNLFSTAQNTFARAVLLSVISLAAIPLLAQEPQGERPSQPAQKNVVTVPAGTRIPLVLTHPVQSRVIHRGDDIYAQVTAPVRSGDQMVIPPGTFVQGTVEKLDARGGRGQLHLQSMAVIFPDGYVTVIPGPLTLQSDEGYAEKDPGNARVMSAVALPLAGAGLGAVIGHGDANTTPQTITTSLPPGCVGTPPGCLSSSMTVPRSAGAATVIGAGVGGAVGAVASLIVIFSSHHFYLDAGTPVDMVLAQEISFQQSEISKAVQQSAGEPVALQTVAPRPVPPPPPPTPANHGTCYTPGTPGTPATVIPGTPGPNGVPGPPTVIPEINPSSSTIPKFDEFTVVLKGMLRMEHKDGSVEVRAGQALIAYAGECVRYSTPEAGCPNTCT